MKNNKTDKTTSFITKRKKVTGYALIEVLIAALVMAVGCVAFLKLQSVSLKNGHNNYARTQAMTISSDFIERLRGNQPFLGLPSASRSGAFVGGRVNLVAAPQSNSACNSSTSSQSCVSATFNYQRYLTSLRMLAEFPQDLSLMCFREDDTANAVRGYMRITFLWRDSQSSNKSALTAGDCPENFSASNLERNNSVTIYAQL